MSTVWLAASWLWLVAVAVPWWSEGGLRVLLAIPLPVVLGVGLQLHRYGGSDAARTLIFVGVPAVAALTAHPTAASDASTAVVIGVAAVAYLAAAARLVRKVEAPRRVEPLAAHLTAGIPPSPRRWRLAFETVGIAGAFAIPIVGPLHRGQPDDLFATAVGVAVGVAVLTQVFGPTLRLGARPTQRWRHGLVGVATVGAWVLVVWLERMDALARAAG